MTNKREVHTGVDIAAPEGTPVAAVSDGVVSEAGLSALEGKYVKIETDHGYTVIYAHLSEISVKERQRVEQGEVVALSGSTGRSSGPHLHYGVYKDGELQDVSAFLRIRFEPDVSAYVVAN